MKLVDFHETEEAAVLVYNLGRLSLEWNMVEHLFSTLIWQYIGDFNIGMTITSGLGNVSRADIILALARQRPENPELLDRVEFACKAFNILRENRNILIHSHSIFPVDGGKPVWRRAARKNRNGHVSAEADFADLERLVAETCSLGKFVVQLLAEIKPFNSEIIPTQLPEKFAMPTKIKTLSDDD